jgi:ubiquinone/menaquinone biosynthesis C-methylase UbiE
MSLLVPARRYDPDVPEMIDNPDADAELLRGELKSIRTINRLFGGYASIRRGMELLLADIKKEEISILDLGTGSADLPMYLLELGLRLNRRFRITAVDNHPRVLEVARERTSGHPEISIETGNLMSLNYPPGAIDVVICSLTLHHFSREDAIKIICSMNRFSRIGYLVNDLNRSRIAAWTTKGYTHLITRNRMTLTDSYLSVLRGFTLSEIRDMAREAGLQNIEIYPQPFFRFLLVGRHQLGSGL